MIIIRVSGGLGNQMFQYALYEKMRSLGKDAKLDLSFYETKQTLRKFELDLFDLSYEVADRRDCARLGECTYRQRDKLRRKLFGPHKSYYEEDLDKGFQPEIFEKQEAYLDGYWQCERYFWDIRQQLLKDFSFPDKLSKKGASLLERIENTQSVSVHVRRGDYLNAQNFRVYGNICTEEYYHRAMEQMKKRCKKPVFYLFTNDTEWVRDHLFEPGMEIIGPEAEKADYEDMYLMSRCRHNIIANSSFSWWGAWLNEHEDKKVLTPDRWFNNHEVSDAICKDWIRVKKETHEESERK